ncbi:MAG TPA: hypothetical protein VFW43_08545 [Polaromonas sp.]|nr:hypothetical protein [Polaromonas sp.]
MTVGLVAALVAMLLPGLRQLHRAGYAVLLTESRNHGRSDRDGYNSLPRLAQDLDSALDWQRQVIRWTAWPCYSAPRAGATSARL